MFAIYTLCQSIIHITFAVTFNLSALVLLVYFSYKVR